MTPQDEAAVAKVEEPAAEVVAPLVTPEPSEKKKAVIVAAGATVPKADISIVIEARTYAKPDEDGVSEITVKKDRYPTGADVYLRWDPEVIFPKEAAKVMTMGVDVGQGSFAGFTRQVGVLNVGPAHPAFAAANLAYQMGATDIEIIGLTDAEKARLQPYFDALAAHPAEPAQVAVSLT